MTIRRAQNKDIPEVHELLAQVDMVHHVGRPDIFKIGNKYNDDELMELIKDDNRPIFVAVDENDKTLGYAFCIFKQFENDNVLTDIKTLYIDDLCVFENLRGQHIGRALYEYTKDFAKKSGCYNLTLNVWSCNESAQRFYESVGMKPQKVGMETIL
ncbi:GNAT family N-acetyltransferase [Butyrivibrio sp. DSM 10294]|uniref:GNAT family N-acetyltransferase n=1 Tax=Butyrivibrio sp. DSM 10294 TaxID=2972457 RepID=UPI00234EFD48|nr:GNAT family N-acetyltransferase [Butyrivibrio sp. DSM 10294]MDC7295443.1 GNAT family N-acetyltransferase [Butyrivibrio sp. DSM 10294]